MRNETALNKHQKENIWKTTHSHTKEPSPRQPVKQRSSAPKLSRFISEVEDNEIKTFGHFAFRKQKMKFHASTGDLGLRARLGCS